jgi:hypothetical protein
MRMHLALIRSLAVVVCAVLLVTACADDDDDDVADEIEGDVIGSPTAAAGLEEDIEEVSIEISDGELAEDEIELTEERPTVLRVTNHDDEAYVLRIDPLVTETMIPAGDAIAIEFTTPAAETYTGELLPESGDEPLDTMRVLVNNAAGNPD